MPPFVLTNETIKSNKLMAINTCTIINLSVASGGRVEYPLFNIDRADGSGSQPHLRILISEDPDINCYVPLYYQGADGRLFKLKTHGSFNVIYFPCDNDTKEFVSNPTVIFRVPFSNDELTETSDRTVRLWNELYQKLYPDRPELATARIYGEGALLPFIDYVRNANQAEILEMQWAVFATNRVYLDAISPGNIVIGSGGETFILDPGNVIKFSGPEDLEKSQVSLDVIPCLLGRYGWFLVQYSKDPRYDKVSIFTQALIALGALNLLLKPGVNLVDRDFQGNLLHWNLIAELSKLFLSLIKKVSLPQSDLFAPEASDNLAERNAIIENFADLYNLTGEEINVLRLTPSVSLYEEPMKNLSYFRTNFRFDILQTYSLVSERFFHVAAFLLLKPLSFRINDFRSFEFYYNKKYHDQAITDRYFIALKTLSEKSNAKERAFFAFYALKDLSECDAEFLARGYEFGLKRSDITPALSNDTVRQDKIIQAFVEIQKGLVPGECLTEKHPDFSVVLLASTDELDEIISTKKEPVLSCSDACFFPATKPEVIPPPPVPKVGSPYCCF